MCECHMGSLGRRIQDSRLRRGSGDSLNPLASKLRVHFTAKQ